MADPLRFIEPRESLDPADDVWPPEVLIRTPAPHAVAAGTAALVDAATVTSGWSPRAMLFGAAIAVELAMRAIAGMPAERDGNHMLQMAGTAVRLAWRHLSAQSIGPTARHQHELRIASRDVDRPESWLAGAALWLTRFNPDPAAQPPPAHQFTWVLYMAGAGAALSRVVAHGGDPATARIEHLHEFVRHWSATFRRRLSFRHALEADFATGEPPTLGFAPARDDGRPEPDMISLPGAVMEFAEDEGTLRLSSGRAIERARLRGSGY